MTYRNITVNGTDYKYVIGKTHTKIVGLGTFENSVIGNPIYDKFVVTPQIIKNVINGDKTPVLYSCTDHNHISANLDFDPFGYEIYGKKYIVCSCEECLNQSAMDI